MPAATPSASAGPPPAYLVTGAAGFLGQALVRALRARGAVVHAFDRRPPTAFAGDPGVRVFAGDVREVADVRAAAAGTAAAFHTAAVMSFLGVDLCPAATRRATFDVNVGGTRSVIAACEAEGVGALLYTSSHNVCYSPAPIEDGDESWPVATRPLDVYTASKIEAEGAVLAADRPGALRTVAFRPGGLWAADPGSVMMTRFVEELVAGKFVALLGDGSARADNTHLDNLVHAQLLALDALVRTPDAVGGRAYFVTDEEPMNLMEWFRPLVLALGFPFPTRRIPRSVLYGAGYAADLAHRLGGPPPALTRLDVYKITTSLVFRCDRARADLGWRPIVTRDTGFRRCLPLVRDLAVARRSGGARPRDPGTGSAAATR